MDRMRMAFLILFPVAVLLVGCGTSGQEAPTPLPEPTSLAVTKIVTKEEPAQRSLSALRKPRKVDLAVISLQHARQEYLEAGCLGCASVLGEQRPGSTVVIVDLNGDGLKDAFVINPKVEDSPACCRVMYHLRHTGTTLERVDQPRSDATFLIPAHATPNLTAYVVNSKDQLALIIEYSGDHNDRDHISVLNGATERYWNLDSNYWWDNVEPCCGARDLKRHVLTNIDADVDWELLVTDLKKPVYVFQLNDTGRGVSHEPDLERSVGLAIGDYISAARQDDADLAGRYWDLHGSGVSLAALAIAHGVDISDYHRRLADMLNSGSPLEQAIIDSIDMEKIEAQLP